MDKTSVVNMYRSVVNHIAGLRCIFSPEILWCIKRVIGTGKARVCDDGCRTQQERRWSPRMFKNFGMSVLVRTGRAGIHDGAFIAIPMTDTVGILDDACGGTL
jgi:hypothetical protein